LRTRNFKGKRKVEQVKDGGFNEQQLDLLERFDSSRSPKESPFLGACCNGGHNRAEPLNETSVKRRKPLETSDVMDVIWGRPLQDGTHLLEVSRNTLSRHDKPKEKNTGLRKRTFLEVNKKTLKAERSEYLSKVAEMLFQIPAENEDVIEIHHNKFVEKRAQNLRHDLHERARSI